MIIPRDISHFWLGFSRKPSMTQFKGEKKIEHSPSLFVMQLEKSTPTGDDDVRSSMYVRHENSNSNQLNVIVNQQQDELCSSCGCAFSWIFFIAGFFTCGIPWLFGPFFFFSRDRGAKIGAIASSVALGIGVVLALIILAIVYL